MWIHVPCVQRDRFDYGEWLRATHREARIEAREVSEVERPVFHPEPGGLLAWGCTRGSDVPFWDTSASADPDKWTVAVQHSGAVPGSGLLRWHRYDLTLTEYLRHTVRDTWELPSPPGPLLGPLPGTGARTALLPDAERRIALESGTGLGWLRLLSPPRKRPYLGDGSWEALFAELGTRLPGEYMRLMDEYGAGKWSGWLRFHTPLRTRERRFVTHVEDTADDYRQLKDGNAD
ncbi:hypothetical protein ACHGLA_00635 [Streptomyces sp. YH02]|uniref:hypothetical protein n=1 Tax=Streptomyces sp. YH02 TaxID=3256999 RepID=UPI003756EEB1